MAFRRLNSCLACAGAELENYLDLGAQPLANSYHDNSAELPRYPLGVSVCPRCWHNQLTVAVDPAEMFVSYPYVSGTSEHLRAYFEDFARRVTQRRGGAGSVCDIGCNDGSQLNAFAKLGWRTFGADPSENLAGQRAAGGHKTITGFFGRETARQLQDEFGVQNMDVLTAQNVFAHTADVGEFLAGCRILMSPSSRLLIQTSQATMFENNEFDTVYHEHVSFFSASSMSALARRAGFVLTDAEVVNIHGNSYVFTLAPESSPPPKVMPGVAARLQAEAPRYDLGFYARFAENVGRTLDDFNRAVGKLRGEGRKLVGLGAAAKGMTFLNSARCRLDYILDKNPLKCGLFTPGENIPIVPQEQIREEQNPVALVPLAWNFYDEIIAQVRETAPSLDYVSVRYFPRVKIDKPD